MDAGTIFMDNLLDCIEEFVVEVALSKAKNVEFRDKYTKMEEAYENLKVRYEYTERKYAQTKKEVKNIGAARDQGFDEILKLQKSPDDGQNEIVVLKKFVGQGPIGSTARVKVKETDFYDGMRSAKALGNFLWDMEQYLECLGIPDDEAKVKVATQFLTKDVNMWWRRKLDQIANDDVDDISTWDAMKKYLQDRFSP